MQLTHAEDTYVIIAVLLHCLELEKQVPQNGRAFYTELD